MSGSRRRGTPSRRWSGGGRAEDDLACEGAVGGTRVDGWEVGHRNALGDANRELTSVDAGGELGQLRGVAADKQIDTAYVAGRVGRGRHPHGGVDDDPTIA